MTREQGSFGLAGFFFGLWITGTVFAFYGQPAWNSASLVRWALLGLVALFVRGGLRARRERLLQEKAELEAILARALEDDRTFWYWACPHCGNAVDKVVRVNRPDEMAVVH